MAQMFQGAGQVGGWIVERNGNVIADGAGTHSLFRRFDPSGWIFSGSDCWHPRLQGICEESKNWVSLNLPFNHDVKRRQSKLALFLVSADLKSIVKGY